MQCVIRLDNRAKGTWQLECTMKRPPIWKTREEDNKQPEVSIFYTQMFFLSRDAAV